jgi:hypothetical protein
MPIALVAAAIATATLLLALRLRLEPPTVPGYFLRGADEGGPPPALHPGQLFRIDIEPEGQVTGAIGARAFLVRGDEVRPWEPTFDVDRDGSVHVAGKVEKLFADVPPGAWELAVAIGRPETLPTAPHDSPRAPDGGTTEAAWRLVRERIVLGP